MMVMTMMMCSEKKNIRKRNRKEHKKNANAYCNWWKSKMMTRGNKGDWMFELYKIISKDLLPLGKKQSEVKDGGIQKK